MRIRRKISQDDVEPIKGKPSKLLADRCPDRRASFPCDPCTNAGCEFRVDQRDYMNCSFVAAEAGGAHTLESIGEMLGITREGVRVIEVRALKKLRRTLEELDAAAVQEQPLVAGNGHKPSGSEVAQRAHKCHSVLSYDGRAVGQLVR